MKKSIVIVGLAAALGACTSAPPATTAVDAGSGLFGTSPGGGTIYIVRGRDAVFLAGAPVKLDGQPVASLRRLDYVKLDVPPGQHSISCGDTDTPHVVDVEPGRLAFVEAQLRVGWMAPHCSLLSLDDLNGRQRVMEGDRVAPRT
jgi:hypothetical protein